MSINYYACITKNLDKKKKKGEGEIHLSYSIEYRYT